MPDIDEYGYRNPDYQAPLGTLNSGGGEGGAVLVLFYVSSEDGSTDTWSISIEVIYPDASPPQDIFTSLSLVDCNGATMLLNSVGTSEYDNGEQYDFEYVPGGDNESSWTWSFTGATYLPLVEGDSYTVTVV